MYFVMPYTKTTNKQVTMCTFKRLHYNFCAVVNNVFYYLLGTLTSGIFDSLILGKGEL